jgi:dienelactone hydrolase
MTRKQVFQIPVLFLAMFFLCQTVAWADLYEVRIERGKRKTSLGDSIAYSLFIPVSKPTLPPPPWPAVVLTHGFGRTHRYHSRNAFYMARRGIVVLIPDMTSLTLGRPAQRRNISNTVDHLVWLKNRSEDDQDGLKGLIDTARIGIAGHSAGGAVSFEATLQGQERGIPVAALCLLDAVPWDRTLGKASSLRPLAFASLRSEESPCNFQGKVLALLDRLTFPCEDVQIVGAKHCDAENPTSAACWLLCGGSDGERQGLYQRLMYLFFKDALGVVSIEDEPETYESLLDTLESRGAVLRLPQHQKTSPSVWTPPSHDTRK